MPELLGITALVGGLVFVGILSLKYTRVLDVLVLAFLFRAFAACIHYWVYPLPYGEKDAVGFEQVAWEWAQGGLGYALMQFDPTGSYVYSWFASLLYAIVDRSPLMLQAINVLGGTLIVLNSYLITKSLWGRDRARTVAWLVAFFPFLIQISAVTHREVAIVYPFTLGVFFLVKWSEKSQFHYLILGTLFLVISTLFHGGMVMSLVATGIFVLVSTLSESIRSLLEGKLSVPAAVAGVFVVLTIMAGITVGNAPRLSSIGDTSEVGQEMIENRIEARTRGKAAYLQDIIPRSTTDLIIQTPVRFVYLLFSPMPWDVRSAYQALGLADVLLYAVVFFGLWRSRHKIIRNRGSLLVLSILAILLVAFSITTSNAGNAIRHRSKFLPIIASLWAVPIIKHKIWVWGDRAHE